MDRVILAAGALALGTTAAFAGGIERSSQSVAILFEQGTYAELSFSLVNPNVSGTLGGGAVSSGDMSPHYATFSLGYKQELNDKVDVALIVDQPVGAKVAYPTGTGYVFAGSTADLESLAVTGLLRYKLPSNISVYGGVRLQSLSGDVAIPVQGYTMSVDPKYAAGYVVGVAWEKPEIAARVALTYNSEIEHTFDVTENGAPSDPFSSTVPQSINLEFQTGIAKDTLLFGSVRWAEWTSFAINPLGNPGLVTYDDDIITYNLGIGRKFNDTWSGAVTVGHEKANGNAVGNLGPTDGFTSVGLAATYTKDKVKITGGVRYIAIGDATTRGIAGDFADNSGFGAGVRIGMTF